MSLPVIQKLVGYIEGSNITTNVYTDISFDFITQELKKINNFFTALLLHYF